MPTRTSATRKRPNEPSARPSRKTSGSKRPRQPMPAFVRSALRDRDLLGAYRERPAYQQNDYLLWISAAKREDTQRKRLDQMLNELERGDRYMKMRWSPARRAARVR